MMLPARSYSGCCPAPPQPCCGQLTGCFSNLAQHCWLIQGLAETSQCTTPHGVCASKLCALAFNQKGHVEPPLMRCSSWGLVATQKSQRIARCAIYHIKRDNVRHLVFSPLHRTKVHANGSQVGFVAIPMNPVPWRQRQLQKSGPLWSLKGGKGMQWLALCAGKVLGTMSQSPGKMPKRNQVGRATLWCPQPK